MRMIAAGMETKPAGVLVLLPYAERAALAMLAEAARLRLDTSILLQKNVSLPASLTRSSRSRLQAVNGRGHHLRRVANALDVPRISLAAMHRSKVMYAREASRRSAPGRATVGFPGASREVFARHDGRRVFHAVDAHPRAHNESLLAHYSTRECRAELYPEWLIERIEAELDLADVVLVPSRLVASQMLHYGVDENKVAVEPYGVDLDLFSPPKDRLAPAGRTQLLYVGQISKRKGIPHLVEAVRNQPVDLTIVGNQFDRSILRKVPSNVKVLAPADHATLARLYASADAFVLPTVEDACSLVALEAAATGLPVLTTTMNGAAEILDASTTAIFAAGDVGALREAIGRTQPLPDSDRLDNAARTRGTATVRSWDDYARTVLSDHLLGGA